MGKQVPLSLLQQHIPDTVLKQKYGWQPFSVLDSGNAVWLRRKREWRSLFGDGTKGRSVCASRFASTAEGASVMATHLDWKTDECGEPILVSSFDPVLAEMLIRWFSRKDDLILDPFAGGITRGAVAEVLGRSYFGIDLNEEQVKTNQQINRQIYQNYADIKGCASWVAGDSDEVLDTICVNNYGADMVFTCPPYFTLERYSDDPRDLSTMQDYYGAFLPKYASILEKANSCLKPDSFFVVVVGEVRSRSRGLHPNSTYLVGLVPDTVNILRGLGLKYYNDMVLVNPVGTLAIRAGSLLKRNRKIARQHQSILVFYKGSIEHIKDKFSDHSF